MSLKRCCLSETHQHVNDFEHFAHGSRFACASLTDNEDPELWAIPNRIDYYLIGHWYFVLCVALIVVRFVKDVEVQFLKRHRSKAQLVFHQAVACGTLGS
jgi:hypothetical protein